MSDAEQQGHILDELWLKHCIETERTKFQSDRGIADELMKLRHQIEQIENLSGLGRIHDECDCIEGSPCRFHAGIAIHLSYAAQSVLRAESELRL